MSKTSKKSVGVELRKSGASFRVWAPFASSVSVIGSFNNWDETPMTKENDGYWFVDVEGAAAGQEYKYVIRNGDATYYRIDPRALHITTVGGNSIITSTSFDWEDTVLMPVPVEQQVIYELHIGTFFRPDPSIGGTFQDAMTKLDHLVDLGITTIELMPIASMSMEHEWWGYTPNHIYAVENIYGGRHQFLEFVKAAHRRGLAVILDVVYNHLGPVPLDLWQFDGWSQDGKGGIYFYNDWRAATPWSETRPDYGRPEVQQYILDNVRLWMHNCRLDGLRVDSTIYVRNTAARNDDPSTDLPEGWHMLQQINTLGRKINPSALMIAEDIAINEYISKPVDQGGAGFGAQWEVNYSQAIREALKTDDPLFINLSGILWELGRRYNDDVFQRVVYSDSHDSAGNGSARLNEVVAPGKSNGLFARRQSLIAVGLVMTTPGIPMLFQGQEFIQSGSFSDWESLDWENAKRYANITEAFKHLIALRRNKHGVTAGLSGRSFNLIHLDQNNKVIAYHRWQNGGPKDDVVIIINFGHNSYTSYNLNLPRNGTWKVRFNSTWKGYSKDFSDTEVPDVEVDSGSTSIVVPANSVIILSQDE